MSDEKSGISRKEFVGTSAAGVAGAVVAGSGIASAATKPPKPPGQVIDTLAAIYDYGRLRVGVNDNRSVGLIDWALGAEPEYAPITDPEAEGYQEPEGFDPDLARALAAAIFGTSVGKIEWVPVSNTGRFTELRDGNVDIVFRGVSKTAKRDIYDADYDSGFNFAPTMYFDGQDIFLKDGQDLSTPGLKIAVKEGTTSANNLAAYLTENYPGGAVAYPITSANQALIAAYNGEEYDGESFDEVGGISSDSSILKGLSMQTHTGLKVDPATGGFPGKTLNLNLSKEALTPMIRQNGDEKWMNLVTWVMNALILAEEAKITKQDVPGDYLSQYAEHLGVPESWAHDAISEVGNFAEIWEERLNQKSWELTGTPWEREFYNTLYKRVLKPTNGGNLYSAPA